MPKRESVRNSITRRDFLAKAADAAALANLFSSPLLDALVPQGSADSRSAGRIVDCHVHFDDKNTSFIEDLVKVCNRLNLTACLLTPYANRRIVADAAKRYPVEIVPLGFLDLDAEDAVAQVREFHELGYRGLG